jgi:hypothetical protein
MGVLDDASREKSDVLAPAPPQEFEIFGVQFGEYRGWIHSPRRDDRVCERGKEANARLRAIAPRAGL